MNPILNYIHITATPDSKLEQIISDFEPDKIGILVDENTSKYCLPILRMSEEYNVIEIKSGEKEKNLSTCEKVWTILTTLNFTRKSLLINLGGGVIGDMGGFIAATYKRGIRFINIPTTLLSQVDASIGGKLGVDYFGFKNHIGIFKNPDAVILSELFLKTLPERQLLSGFAEVIKHGLIWDRDYWQKVTKTALNDKMDWRLIIKRSVEIKSEIVSKDPMESGIRKILNYGHTLGHAIETWHLENHLDLLHGEAVAAGIILEGHLSFQKGYLSENEFSEITHATLAIFKKLKTIPAYSQLLSLLYQDKKNYKGKISFSLLEGIGRCKYDETVSNDQIGKSLDYYNNLN